jgi:HEAT repeat protein
MDGDNDPDCALHAGGRHPFAVATLLLGIPHFVVSNGLDSMGLPPERRLEQLGIDTSLPALERLALDDANEIEVRGLAVRAIGRSKDLAYAGTLIGLLDKPELRGTAIIALREMGASSTTPHLIDILDNDPDEILQGISIPALAEIAGASAFPPLLNAASDPTKSTIVRANALTAIRGLVGTGQLDYAAVKDKVTPLLGDPDVNVRSLVAHVMATTKDPQAIPWLVASALDDATGSWIRARAIRDLERLTDQDFGYRNPASQPELESALQIIETWWIENRLRYGDGGS